MLAVDKMPVMLAAFLTNAAMSSVAVRLLSQRLVFEMSGMFDHEQVVEKKHSAWLTHLNLRGSFATRTFTLAIQVAFMAVSLSW